MENLKEIHIGKMLQLRTEECDIDMYRICSFFKCSETEIVKMYESRTADTETLLRWSKLLEYDFFRLYSQHLVLFAPPASTGYCKKVPSDSKLPKFRKNLYTKEVIDFILDLIQTGKKTKAEVVQDYNIPKTTLHKWISKQRFLS